MNYIRISGATDGIHIRFDYASNKFGIIIRYPEFSGKSAIELWKVNSSGSASVYAQIYADYVAS